MNENRIMELTRDYMLEDNKLTAVEARRKAVDKVSWEQSVEEQQPRLNNGLVGTLNG